MEKGNFIIGLVFGSVFGIVIYKTIESFKETDRQ